MSKLLKVAILGLTLIGLGCCNMGCSENTSIITAPTNLELSKFKADNFPVSVVPTFDFVTVIFSNILYGDLGMPDVMRLRIEYTINGDVVSEYTSRDGWPYLHHLGENDLTKLRVKVHAWTIVSSTMPGSIPVVKDYGIKTFKFKQQ